MSADGATAWAVLGSWRGSPKLLAHLARRMEAEAQATGVVIEVRVGDDCECFESPEEFLDQVTSHALQSFDRLRIVATGRSLTIDVRLQRRQYANTKNGGAHPPDALPRAGGVLSVTGPDAHNIRKKLVPALKRGSLHRPGSGAILGPDRRFRSPEEALNHRGRPTDRLEILGALAMTVLVAVAASFVRLSQEVRCDDGPQPDCRETYAINLAAPTWGEGVLFAGGMGVLLGLALAIIRWKRPDWNPMLRVWSPIEVADKTIMRSLLKSATTIVPVGALVGWASQFLASIT